MIASTIISSSSVKPFSPFDERKRQSRQHCDYKTDFEVPWTVLELDRVVTCGHGDAAIDAVGARDRRGQAIDRRRPGRIERVAKHDDGRLRERRVERHVVR